MIRLYVGDRSGNSHKIALFLSILGLPHETVEMEYGRSLRTPEFLAKNPRGQVPVLEVDGKFIWDSQAILVYLARAHGGERWLPTDAAGMAEVVQWLALAENEHLFGIAQARIMLRYRASEDELVFLDMKRARTLTRRGLTAMERRLSDHDWLALDRPTIAEMACYTYPALHQEAEIDMTPYPSVMAWLGRVQALPGFIPMVGT
jgi:glutathione S-transferase